MPQWAGSKFTNLSIGIAVSHESGNSKTKVNELHRKGMQSVEQATDRRILQRYQAREGVFAAPVAITEINTALSCFLHPCRSGAPPRCDENVQERPAESIQRRTNEIHRRCSRNVRP
ncbi:uncharacterized protein LOC110117424 [Athalia rosae]|uniref:uncharacterized protein LOC110117424 n=1 Tax=Athalia rosae TaxID=37344 RepID=UPI00203490FE|nr:uncharacterized protein LOC110117424 [Athalia rosae]